MIRHLRLAKKNFQKNSKTKKLPPKTPQNQKSKKECSSKLMLKTKNVQTLRLEKNNFQKIQKLKN